MYSSGVPSQTLNDAGQLFLPEAVRIYASLVAGDFVEFVMLPGHRVLLGRVPADAERPVRPHSVLSTSGTVQVPLVVRRHLQVEKGDDIEYLRVQERLLEIEKANRPPQRSAAQREKDLGDRGPGRGLDMLVSISVDGDD